MPCNPTLGTTPNLMKTLAVAPAALKGYLDLNDALATRESSIAVPRSRSRIAVAQANACDYCLAAHHALGALAGLTPDEMARDRDARSAGAYGGKPASSSRRRSSRSAARCRTRRCRGPRRRIRRCRDRRDRRQRRPNMLHELHQPRRADDHRLPARRELRKCVAVRSGRESRHVRCHHAAIHGRDRAAQGPDGGGPVEQPRRRACGPGVLPIDSEWRNRTEFLEGRDADRRLSPPQMDARSSTTGCGRRCGAFAATGWPSASSTSGTTTPASGSAPTALSCGNSTPTG